VSRFINSSVGEALSADVLQHGFRALLVIDAERNAVVVAELEFGEIALQVILRALPIHALHAALEDREEVGDLEGALELPTAHAFLDEHSR
jgi:hypothetical protein